MWSSVVGQHRAKDNLQRAILNERVAHAYCFWGAEATAAEALALEFARCLNCQNPQKTESGVEACGQCKSCTQTEHLQHPNIKLIFALPAGKGSSGDDDDPASRMSEEQLSDIQEQIRLKAENPYHDIQLSNASQIRIASIREVKKSIQFSASQSGHRVVILCDADQMTTEAANAFLKTLEEPQNSVTLILCTARRELLPQTILSRCQQIHLELLTVEEIQQALVEQYSMDDANALLCASLAQGSLTQALSFQNDDAQQLRNDVVDLLRSALRPGAYRVDLMAKLDELTHQADRASLEKMLSLLMIWLRDALLMSTTNSNVGVINRDQLPTLEKFVQAYGSKDTMSTIALVEDCIRSIKGNGQVHVNLVCMLIGIRQIFLAA